MENSSKTKGFSSLDKSPEELGEYCEIVFQDVDYEEPNEENESESGKIEYISLEDYSLDKWTDEALSALVSNRLKIEHLFRNSKIRKIKLWERISKKLCDESHYYSAEGCEAKFRSLIGHYRMLAQKKCIEGGSFTTDWQWFAQFDSVYQHRPYLGKPPHYLLGSTLEKNVNCKYHKENLRISVNKIMKNYAEDYEDDDNYSDRGSGWDRDSTNVLLKLRNNFSPMFNIHGFRKNRIWQKIAAVMRQNGYSVPAKKCAIKYRNLVGTYKKILQRKVQCPDMEISWEFFDLMQEIEEKCPERVSENDSDDNEDYSDTDMRNEIKIESPEDSNESYEEQESSHSKASPSPEPTEDNPSKRVRLEEQDDAQEDSRDSSDPLQSNQDRVTKTSSEASSAQEAYWQTKLKLLERFEDRKMQHLESMRDIQMEQLKLEKEKVEALKKLANAFDRISRSSYFDE